MVRTRSASYVRVEDKVTSKNVPSVQVTFSTDDKTTEVSKQPDDGSSRAIVETCINLDEEASSSSAISSESIGATPSCPAVEIEVDSCSSAVSSQSSRPKTRSTPRHGTPFTSATQRVTRSRQKVLSQTKNPTEESVSSSEKGSDSETPRVSSRRSTRFKKTIFYPSDDLVEEVTDVQSTASSLCSTQGLETPCSSRTGSGYSSCGAPSTSGSVRNSVIDSVKPVEECRESNHSSSDCTSGQRSDEVLHLTSADPDKTKVEIIVLSEDDSDLPTTASDDPACVEEAVHDLEIISEDQQVELPDESKGKDPSETRVKEQILSAEPSEPPLFVTETICEKASEIMVETEEKQGEANTAEGVGPLCEAAVVESSTTMGDSEKVVELQQRDVVAKSVPEKTIISLLDSSDEDDESDVEEEEMMEASEEEETSKSTKVSDASVDGLFMIDTRPGTDVDDQYYKDAPEGEEAHRNEEAEEEDEFIDEGEDDDDAENALVLFSRRESQLKEMSSRIDPSINIKDFGGLHITFDGTSCKPSCSSSVKRKEKSQDDVMKKSVIGPDFEKKDAVPARSNKKHAKAEREKTAGAAWFNMKAPELTQEMKQDLQVLKMRGALDFKRFYKKSDREAFPKYFQFGTVVDSPMDYHSRIPKKERKRTMVEELLADAEFRRNNKKKYQNIISERGGKRKKKNR